MKARENGIIIGCLRDTTVDDGDALYHIAQAHDPVKAELHIQKSSEVIEDSLESHYTGE